MGKRSKSDKEKLWILKPQLISALRRLYGRSPIKSFVLNEAKTKIVTTNKDGSTSKKNRVNFKCAHCTKLFEKKDVNVDHTDPVINPETGYIDWNTYISRLFILDAWNVTKPTVEQKELARKSFSVLCLACHSTKTATELVSRRQTAKKRKKTDDKHV